MIHGEMMQRMSGRELLKWGRFFQLEPPGDRLVASMLHNINRQENAPFVWPHEFMTALTPPAAAPDPVMDDAVFEDPEPKKKRRRLQ